MLILLNQHSINNLYKNYSKIGGISGKMGVKRENQNKKALFYKTFTFIVVSWWRFELQTDRLEGDCSIQLSYQDIRSSRKLPAWHMKKTESKIWKSFLTKSFQARLPHTGTVFSWSVQL